MLMLYTQIIMYNKYKKLLRKIIKINNKNQYFYILTIILLIKK